MPGAGVPDTSSMDRPAALLLTDLVDSVAVAEQLGDAAMAQVWSQHDRLARDLLREWRGREIDKTDGFLFLFAEATDALGYALAYHRALAGLALPGQPGLQLRARAALHVGQVSLRANPAADVALGAKPVEVDGVSKPLAARVMSTARGGQTLLTAAALEAVGTPVQRVVSHGHWRVKGLPVPLELFEVGDAGAPFAPPPDSEKVYRVVRSGPQGDLWLPAREMRHSLPAERDAFVGRRSTLQAMAQRFEDGARLVSLLGVGGSGKTRLATRFGWAWMGDFPGGVWFCDLAPARGMDGIVHAVAQGLELPLGKDDPVQQLGHAIAGRGACLVILDNFEHLARHAEATLGRWLERAGQARFLVTTREVLAITGEEALLVQPLPLADAEKLFLRRAAAAKRDFLPGPEDQAAIPELVRLLDGLPLAIELAAARVRALAPRALLARMSERFRLLASSGSRLDRQATLRATFDWSWELLSAAEKAALAQLAVFEGGFTLESAEAVIALDALADAPWTVDVVNSLVDKSFVRALQGERFDLLVSVQDYAAEHLATPGRWNGSGPEARQAAELRHVAWFAGQGGQAGGSAELDNLAVACRRACAAGEAALAAGALDGAWAAISLHGPFQAAIDLAEAVCALPGLAGSAAAHAHAVLGQALQAAGQRARAVAPFETALAHAIAAGDLRCEAEVTVRLGDLRPATALAQLGRALDLAQQAGDSAIECAALNGLALHAMAQGHTGQARGHYDAALATARRVGDLRWQGHLLGNLGQLQASLGQMAQARALFEEALQLARALGDRPREGNTLSNLGMLHQLQGRLEDAAAALEASYLVARELGHARLEGVSLCNLGLVHAAAGRQPEAIARYEAAIAILSHGGERLEGQVLGHLGLARARLGEFGAARACFDQGLARLHEAAADPASRALLMCQRAEAEWLDAQHDAALRWRAAAAELAATVGAGVESEAGLALARLDRLMAPAAAAEVSR